MSNPSNKSSEQIVAELVAAQRPDPSTSNFEVRHYLDKHGEVQTQIRPLYPNQYYRNDNITWKGSMVIAKNFKEFLLTMQAAKAEAADPKTKAGLLAKRKGKTQPSDDSAALAALAADLE